MSVKLKDTIQRPIRVIHDASRFAYTLFERMACTKVMAELMCERYPLIANSGEQNNAGVKGGLAKISYVGQADGIIVNKLDSAT